MILNKNLTAALNVVLASVVIAGGASAQIVQHKTTSSSGGVLFNTFDTSLGTLTDVRLAMFTSVTGTPKVINSGDPTESWITAYIQANFAATGPDSLANSASVTATDNTGGTVAGNSHVTLPGQSATSPTETVNLTTGLSAFTNPPSGTTLTINVSGTAGAGGTYDAVTSPDISFAGTATPTIDLTLTYFYEAPTTTTPEPGTIALLIASGSVSLVGLRRRRALKK